MLCDETQCQYHVSYLKCSGDLDLERIVKKQLIFSAFSQRVTTDGGGSEELHNRCYPSEPMRQSSHVSLFKDKQSAIWPDETGKGAIEREGRSHKMFQH